MTNCKYHAKPNGAGSEIRGEPESKATTRVQRITFAGITIAAKKDKIKMVDHLVDHLVGCIHIVTLAACRRN